MYEDEDGSWDSCDVESPLVAIRAKYPQVLDYSKQDMNNSIMKFQEAGDKEQKKN